jgi:hypothetical protein
MADSLPSGETPWHAPSRSPRAAPGSPRRLPGPQIEFPLSRPCALDAPPMPPRRAVPDPRNGTSPPIHHRWSYGSRRPHSFRPPSDRATPGTTWRNQAFHAQSWMFGDFDGLRTSKIPRFCGARHRAAKRMRACPSQRARETPIIMSRSYRTPHDAPRLVVPVPRRSASGYRSQTDARRPRLEPPARPGPARMGK